MRKPSTLALHEAPILTGYLTAYYSLVEVARLRADERVLIHNATGGVGLAALQIAQWIGAEIYATAGTEEKRAYLASLGVEKIFDSRSLAFADQIQQATDGEGVDVVLSMPLPVNRCARVSRFWLHTGCWSIWIAAVSSGSWCPRWLARSTCTPAPKTSRWTSSSCSLASRRSSATWGRATM